MKIVSLEENNYIENIYKKDILIPCFMYSIPIEIKEKGLNILEETIYKLKQVESTLDKNEIAKLLGLDNEKKELVKCVLEKIESFKEEEGFILYLTFFKEAYTNTFLPVVAKKIDNFFYILEEKEFKYNTKKIKFQKDNKTIYSIALNSNFYEKKSNQKEFYKILIKNNKNKSSSKYIQKINLNKISNFTIVEPEEVYLHTRLFIPKYNPSDFLITNGFDSGFSFELKQLLQNNFQKLILNLKENIKIDIDDIEYKIASPFKGIEKYPDIKNLIDNIEKNYKEFLNNDLSDIKVKKKEIIIKTLFDVIERSFEIISQSEIKVEKQEVVYLLNSKYNFEFRENMKLLNERKNCLQEYFAKSILLDVEELKELPQNTLLFIEKVLDIRDALRHSKILNLDDIDINQFIQNTYLIISTILNLKYTNEVLNNENIDDSELYFNVYTDIEKDFMEVFNFMDKYIKDKLTDIYFYLNEIGYKKDKVNVSKEVLNNLYSIFEYILKQKIEDKDLKIKDILSKYPNLPKELTTVTPKYVINAQKGINSTLGGVYLVYLCDNYDEKLTNLIVDILKYRGHGDGKVNIKEEKLMEITKKSFEYIKKFILN